MDAASEAATERLEQLEQLVAADPLRAVAHVQSFLDGVADVADQLQAMVLLARVQRSAGHLGLAAATLADAVDRAEIATASGAVLHLSPLIRGAAETYANHGRARAGIELCRRLQPLAHDAERVDLLLVLGALYRDAENRDEARRCADEALVLIDDLGDAERECRLLNNRGVLNLDLGHFEAAEADFLRAERVARALGLELSAASCEHNRGVALGRQGQMHRALELLDRSAAFFEREGHDFALLEALLDRVSVLLDSGLNEEARAAARLSADAHARFDARSGLETTRYLQSRIEGADGNWSAAVAFAAQAVELVLADDGDPTRLARATERVRLLELVADDDGDLRTEQSGVAPSADSLDDSTVAEIGMYLVKRGRDASARPYLRLVADSSSTSSLAELHRCLARAQLARLDDDLAATARWVSAGLAAAESNTLCLAATDIRTLALRRIAQLGEIGLRLALADDSALAAAAVIDRVRAVSLQPEPLLTQQEVALVARLRVIRNEGWQYDIESEVWASRLDERARVEAALRASRRHRSGNREPASAVPRLEGLRHPLETRLFLEELGGRVVAVVVRPDDEAIVDLGPAADLRRQLSALSLLLDAVAAQTVANSDVDGLVRGLRATFARVLEPGDNGKLVVVCDARIPLVPWSLLTRRPVTLLPSLAAHPSVGAAIDPRQRLHIICGPDLPAAAAEVAAIIDVWSRVERLAGAGATVDAALDVFAEADLLHVIAHGRFRPDNPLFSEVQLVDGPMTLYDLLSRTASPRHIVFASCEVGRDSGSSSLGAYSVLSARGCVSMVAACGLVRDRSVARLMGKYYEHLASSGVPSIALATAQHELLDEDPSLSLFTCFGPA